MAYKFPPYSWGGILLSEEDGKHLSKQTMESDFDILLKLERVAGLVPVVSEFLADVADLFPPAIRVTMETFNRDKFNVRSINGRRVLSTILLIMSDNKAVEEFHLNIRKAEALGVNKVITRVTRSRACMNSKIIEQRGVKHERVTREEFMSNWHRRRALNIAWRFCVNRHKFHPR